MQSWGYKKRKGGRFHYASVGLNSFVTFHAGYVLTLQVVEKGEALWKNRRNTQRVGADYFVSGRKTYWKKNEVERKPEKEAMQKPRHCHKRHVTSTSHTLPPDASSGVHVAEVRQFFVMKRHEHEKRTVTFQRTEMYRRPRSITEINYKIFCRCTTQLARAVQAASYRSGRCARRYEGTVVIVNV